MEKKLKVDSTYKDLEVNYGIQVIFSTIPNQEREKFENDIEETYFTMFQDGFNSINEENSNDFLYRPLKFYMLGDYDVCYITLINNFKFSHRLFESKIKDQEITHNAHTFQSYTGFVLDRLNNNEKIETLFSKRLHQNNKKNGLYEHNNIPLSDYFIGVFNLKLNNGLLLGNGIRFVETVYKLIEKIIKVPFIVSQTFSWFELSLIVFVKSPEEIKNILKELRSVKFLDALEIDSNLTSSLYHSEFFKDVSKRINETSIFSDTHTYFGFNESLINGDVNDNRIIDFKKQMANVKLNTEIEWHVKPGHIPNLESVLEKRSLLKSYFKTFKRKFILGKSDFLLQEDGNQILFNYELLRYIHGKESTKLYEYIRNVKSYVYFDVDKKEYDESTDEMALLTWDKELLQLAIPSKTFFDIDVKLKSMKISRQIRMKVLKVFSNYNHGIQDPILFPFFLDFSIFVSNLISLIINETDEANRKVKSIKKLESQLNLHIKAFQDGYNIRFLNGYQFENISSFSLDFNGSIQLLLTSYSTMVYYYGSLFYNKGGYSPIIQLNNIDTVSNHLSINYAIQHLTSPELVFSTILKEILNTIKFDSTGSIRILLNNLEENIPKIISDIDESYLDDMYTSNMFDINYFIIDSIRFIISFNQDFALFEHWFWVYNFQNSALFNSSGMFNEDHLKWEMLRLSFIKHFFSSPNKMKCPTPELETYWSRHFKKINYISDVLVKNMRKIKPKGKIGMFDDSDFENIIKKIAVNYYSSYSSLDKIDLSDLNHKVINKYVPPHRIVKDLPYNERLKLLLDSKKPDNIIHSLDIIFFYYLNEHFKKNPKGIVSLKRDWKTGNVLKQFKEMYKDSFYAIDQIGGMYFYDTIKANDYFKLNANAILNIIDFSYKQKKEFLITLKKKKKNENR